MANPPRFDRSRLRVLKAADADPAARFFDERSDVQELLTFLWQYEKLGWIPPKTDADRRRLEAYEIRQHTRYQRRFYEYRFVGARGQRVPKLTVFFHLDGTAVVRILAFMLTDDLRRRQTIVLDLVSARAGLVDRMLGKR